MITEGIRWDAVKHPLVTAELVQLIECGVRDTARTVHVELDNPRRRARLDLIEISGWKDAGGRLPRFAIEIEHGSTIVALALRSVSGILCFRTGLDTLSWAGINGRVQDEIMQRGVQIDLVRRLAKRSRPSLH